MSPQIAFDVVSVVGIDVICFDYAADYMALDALLVQKVLIGFVCIWYTPTARANIVRHTCGFVRRVRVLTTCCSIFSVNVSGGWRFWSRIHDTLIMFLNLNLANYSVHQYELNVIASHCTECIISLNSCLSV